MFSLLSSIHMSITSTKDGVVFIAQECAEVSKALLGKKYDKNIFLR
jgi:uncharacterized phosphosugar-binding protein